VEAPPSVVTPDVNQLAAVKSQLVGAKNQLVGAKSQLVAVKNLLVVVKNLLVVVKSPHVVARAMVATQVATVLAARSVDADFWRNFSLRKATAATDASQLVAVKSQHADVKSQLVVAKSQHAVAKAIAATQVATAVVLLRNLADCLRSCSASLQERAATVVVMLANQPVAASQLAAAKAAWKQHQCQHQLLIQVLKRPASVASFRPVPFSFAELRNGNALKTFQT
jgi:hypothetical protein